MDAKPKWTPVAQHAQTLLESSLALNDKTPRIKQYRARIAGDMVRTPVLIEDSVVLDHILALPPDIPLPNRSTERKKSPFTDLEGANGMEEADVSALFVCVTPTFHFMLVVDKIAPHIKLPSTPTSLRRTSPFISAKIDQIRHP